MKHYQLYRRIMAILVMIILFTGCETFISSSVTNAQEPEDHYKGSYIIDDMVEVTIDADITIHGTPGAIVKTVPHIITGAEVKQWAEVLFENDDIYEVNSHKTREELRSLIERDQNWLNGLDPEKEPELYEYRQDLYQREIAAFESMLPDAKEAYEPQEPDWTFKVDPYAQTYSDAMGNDPEELNEEIKVFSDMDGKTAFVDCTATVKESFILNWFRFWIEDGYQENELKESPEEAENYVRNKLRELGLAEKWTITSCKIKHQSDQHNKEKDVSLIRNEGYYYDMELVTQYGGQKVLDQEYIFYSPDLTQYPYRYDYEKLHIQYSNGKIVNMDYMDPLEVVAVMDLEVPVIKLEEAIICLQEQMKDGKYLEEFYNQMYHSYPLSMKVQISNIELGLVRIRTSKEDAQYMMTPVWNFKGRNTSYYGIETVTSPLYGDEEVIMTINAMDGSLIKPEEGR